MIARRKSTHVRHAEPKRRDEEVGVGVVTRNMRDERKAAKEGMPNLGSTRYVKIEEGTNPAKGGGATEPPAEPDIASNGDPHPTKKGGWGSECGRSDSSISSGFVAERNLGEDYANEVFFRVLHGRHLREPDNEIERRVILWDRLSRSLRLRKHLLEGIPELDVSLCDQARAVSQLDWRQQTAGGSSRDMQSVRSIAANAARRKNEFLVTSSEGATVPD